MEAMDRKQWKLGDTSAIFESQGTPGTVSTGKGDHGGVSYGTYQFSSNAGTAREFVRQSKYASAFEGLTPGTKEFGDAWLKVASDHPDFGADQEDFIRRTHIDPVLARLEKRGLDLGDRGPAVQDMIWSMSVQYRAHTPSHIQRGLTEAFGAEVDVSALSDVDIVRAVQQSKLMHVHEDFRSSDHRVRESIETRIRAEERALTRLAETGLVGTVAQTNADWNEVSPVRIGSSRPRIADLQERLRGMGILDRSGERVVADGDFGPSTRSAVKTFQVSVGLLPTDAASALTMYHLNAQLSARNELALDRARGTDTVCRLDDAAHPDHDYFRNVRACVMDIDRRLGRSPDQYTDNLASALTVQARADGLRDVGKVTLSTCGEVMWAYQTPPDWGYDLFARDTSIRTKESCTSMEESAAKWPQAIQQFQTLDEARQRSEQDISDRHQARIHGRSEPDYGMAR
jgi:peptidoglycan hydrolase-like protein with peptidoglycan-binding domain